MYRVGITGAGIISGAHVDAIKNLHGRVTLTAVAEINQEVGEKFAKEHDCAFYTNYDDMFQKESLDIACCCLPHGLHYEVGKAALKAGLHLFMEKPMCITTAQCDELNKMADERRHFIMVGHTHQYLAPLLKAKEFINMGKIGQLVIIQTEIIEYYNWENRQPWHLDPELGGGGVLMNTCAHQLDHLLFFAESSVKSVRAIVTANRQGIKVDSDICAIIEFKNGIIGNLTTLQGYRTDEPSSINCRLIGTVGAIRLYCFGKSIVLACGSHREEIQLDPGLFGIKLEWKE